MSDSIFEIGASGIDARRIVEEIRETVARKMERNVYTDSRVACAERFNLANLKDDENFLAFYLDCLREAVFVDIGDFEILERRARFSWVFIPLKRLIWNALKFYTYRLWSQQNRVNGLLLSAIEAAQSRDREKIRQLEERLARIEGAATPSIPDVSRGSVKHPG
ncbi:MAG: hypothetical protein QME60_05230 [Verrucomicrobiota bacterium]|nr:hypothetical protein [Verrucomicrobiota bacterium]